VVAENVQFLGGRSQERPDDRQSAVRSGASDEGTSAGEDIGEDDIPF
jgi:hypothetical protein